MSGTWHIRKAVEILEHSGSPLRQRLTSAVDCWSDAMRSRADWPMPLRGRADCINQKLMVWHNPAVALDTMTDDEVTQIAADIAAFARDAHIWAEDEVQARVEPSHFFG